MHLTILKNLLSISTALKLQTFRTILQTCKLAILNNEQFCKLAKHRRTFMKICFIARISLKLISLHIQIFGVKIRKGFWLNLHWCCSVVS